MKDEGGKEEEIKNHGEIVGRRKEGRREGSAGKSTQVTGRGTTGGRKRGAAKAGGGKRDERIN